MEQVITIIWFMFNYPVAAFAVIGGGLVALVLVRALGRRGEARSATRQPVTEIRAAPLAVAAAEERPSLATSHQDLIMLRLELRRMVDRGELDAELYQRFTEAIDAQWTAGLESIQAADGIWRQRCETAWRVLTAHGRLPAGPPPWILKSSAPPQPRLRLVPTVPQPTPQAIPSAPPTPAETAEGSPPPLGVPPLVDGGQAVPAAPVPAEVTPIAPTDIPVEQPALAAGTKATANLEASYAWQAEEPSALEKALRALSGWPKAMLPFLVQNIGWFIGGFCFLAGSIFLVSYTAGFIRSVVVFAALFAYSGFLFWAGYQMRLKQPTLTAAGDMLLTLGLLLMPLNLSAAVRLLSADAGWWSTAAGSLAAVLVLGVFLVASQVVGGIVDRTLQGLHPRLYTALAAVQLAVPLVARWPVWPVLALLHLLLLGLLGYGLLRYAHEWMHSIFVERRKIAYFAGGTLLYAGLISFVHLTWGVPSLDVPTGYYAPYLMAVCGLLFYVDVQFKEWAHQYAFLSRFSFLLYGLSVLAVALAADEPAARLITLTLGAIVYAFVAWQYLTRIPVYLLLASLIGLYSLLILNQVQPAQHFLWSLPGLIGILTMSRWLRVLADKRRSAYPLALLVYRLLVWLALGLAGWSLWYAQPGLVAMLSAVLLAGGLWWLLRDAPGPLLGRLDRAEPAIEGVRAAHDLRNGPWLYTVILAVTAAAAFAPAWNGLSWELRFALALLLLAWLWTWSSLRTQRLGGPLLTRLEIFANSALLSVVMGVGLAVSVSQGASVWPGFLVLVFGAAAVALLWLSLGLYLRPLFYSCMGLGALAAGLSKIAFFPGPSTGAEVMLTALAIWGLLWWLDRQPDEAAALRRSRLKRPLTLLWVFNVPER